MSSAGVTKQVSRKAVADLELLDDASRKLVASIASEDLNLRCFECGVTLGTGTFGRVFMAKHKQTGSFVAIKRLKKVEVLRLKQVEHVLSEKAILLAVSHPHIVNLWGTFQDNSALYMIMEFVQGGEVFSHLRKHGRFSVDIARVYGAEVCLALAFLHERDIVYRDLKPENLLLDARGHVKITDFGFAKVVKDKTWTLCGTPEYLCPEIIQSKGHNYEADWWAFGILLFEFMAGFPPFFDENPFGIYEKILACKIPFPSFFEANAKDLIKKLCQPDRAKRLGCIKTGVGGIQKHKFFKGLDWKTVSTGPGPILINLRGDSDASNFDSYPPVEEESIAAVDPFKAIFRDF